MLCLEEHLELFLADKAHGSHLTAADIDEQFAEFMENDGYRYPDEHAPELLAEIAYYKGLEPAA